jgi:hypothetical protein
LWVGYERGEEVMSAFAWLVLVKNDIGVLKPEDDGEGLQGGDLPHHLFLPLPSSYSDYSSFTEQTAVAAVLLPPLARCRDGHPCFLCRSGRGLRGERKKAAYLPHQLSALNLLLLPAMR